MSKTIKKRDADSIDLKKAASLLKKYWQSVCNEADNNPSLEYIPDTVLRSKIHDSINHSQVAYRFCLPIQLLGKIVNPAIDSLCLQKKEDAQDVTGWDARTLGSKVVAPFNQSQENVLGTSGDPYVGNPMRIPRMVRDDKSKKDIAGWNVLVDVLEQVELKKDKKFTEMVFRQVLLEILKRQRSLRFVYPLPPRISLETAILLIQKFVEEKSGGDRGLALCSALFDTIGIHFGLYKEVVRGRINASDRATKQAADLECKDSNGKVVLAVEVKERILTLIDIEGTLQKCRELKINDIFFTARGVKGDEQKAIDERISRAFTAGQNVYIFNLLDIARSVLAVGGETFRAAFLQKVGEHLDLWNTQPRHRQAWKKLLEEI